MKGGLDACAVQDKLETKKLSFLELRVNDLKRKLSLQVISNRQRKDQINSLRQKMVLFDTVHGSLGKEFGAHKESMASLMDESNDVYNERQEALEKIRELVSLDLEESADHRALMEELGDLLDKEALRECTWSQSHPSRTVHMHFIQIFFFFPAQLRQAGD